MTCGTCLKKGGNCKCNNGSHPPRSRSIRVHEENFFYAEITHRSLRFGLCRSARRSLRRLCWLGGDVNRHRRSSLLLRILAPHGSGTARTHIHHSEILLSYFVGSDNVWRDSKDDLILASILSLLTE